MTASPNRVLITGAGGFVGGSLAAAFLAGGWTVIGAVRHPPQKSDGKITWREYDLCSNELPTSLLDNVDVVIHAACAKPRRQSDLFAVNVHGSEMLLAATRRAGIHTIFISSLAAHEGAVSGYGRQKLAIEKLMNAEGAIVRPGLVLGSGGLFATLENQLNKYGLVPLVDGGRQPLQTVFIDDLTAAVVAIARQRIDGRFTIAESPAASYRAFFEYLAMRRGVPVRFVRVPSWILEIVTTAAAAFDIRSPIDRDNVRGLKTMRFSEPSRDARILPDPARRYTESIDELIARGPIR